MEEPLDPKVYGVRAQNSFEANIFAYDHEVSCD